MRRSDSMSTTRTVSEASSVRASVISTQPTTEEDETEGDSETPTIEVDNTVVDHVPVECYPDGYETSEAEGQAESLNTGDTGWLDEALDALSNEPEASNINIKVNDCVSGWG